MTNTDLLKQKLALLASSGVLSDSAVSTIDEAIATLEKSELVTRCQDCKFWNDEHDCNIKSGWFRTDPAWYCADGQER